MSRRESLTTENEAESQGQDKEACILRAGGGLAGIWQDPQGKIEGIHGTRALQLYGGLGALERSSGHSIRERGAKKGGSGHREGRCAEGRS